MKRKSQNKVIAGVCSGIAAHYGNEINPNIFRGIFVMCTLIAIFGLVKMGFLFPILYLLLWISIKEE